MADSNMFVNCSRRRIEALKFLSSISLDGTYCNSVLGVHCNGIVMEEHLNSTKLSDYLLEEDNLNDRDGENVFLHNYDSPIVKNNTYDKGKRYSVSSESDISTTIKAILDETLLTKGILSQSALSNKRLRTSNQELHRKNNLRTNSSKKKVHHSCTCSDSERNFGSSCESIYPTTSRLKTKPSTYKPITEVKSSCKVKVVKSVKDHKFNGERIIMVTKNRVPFLVCSFIPYKSSGRNRSEFHKEGLKKRHVSKSRPVSTVGDVGNKFDMFGIIDSEDGQEVSYSKLLVPTRLLKEHFEKKHSNDSFDMTNYTSGYNCHLLARCYSYDQGTQRTLPTASPPVATTKDVFINSKLVYNPTILDDPELIVGRHRTLLTFSSYVTSIIDYVRPYDLKKEINDKFKEKFPYIKLTLSKLRSLKKEMHKVVRSDSGTELVTVAQAYVYFEKLILRGLINKQNRKLCAAASLLLSAKLNDFKGNGLKTVIERIENVFRLNRKELFESEFAVLVALEFSLHIPSSEVFPHYQRLLYAS